MVAFNALKGIGLGMSGGMAMGLVANAILYGQLKTGVNAVGMGNAGTSAAQKLGLGLGQAIFGWVLSGAGFNAALDQQGIAQPETVITAIKVHVQLHSDDHVRSDLPDDGYILQPG